MNKEKLTSFGEQIRALREKTGLPLRKVAAHLDIDPSLLGKIERNERQPNKELIKQIASFFEIDKKKLIRQFVSDQIAYKIIEEGDMEILEVAERKVNYLQNKDLKHPASRLFKSCKWLVWHYKNKANLGNDWGRSHESILLFRKSKEFTLNVNTIRIPYGEHTLKYPSHPQAETSQYGNGKNEKHVWEPNPLGAKPKDVLEIPTTCNGMHEKTPHPTQKPEELLRKILLASSNEGDVVLDPFCGSGTTPVCAEQLQRKWLACDLSPEYLDWAAHRIELVEEWSN